MHAICIDSPEIRDFPIFSIGTLADRTHAQVAESPTRLVLRAARGNRSAFDAIWRLHAGAVHRVLLGMVDPCQADDLSQEVAIQALRRLPTLREPTSFPAWLCTIARNLARDAIAKQQRRPETPLDDALADDLRAPTTRDATEDAIEVERILTEIRRLPTTYRRTIQLRLLQDMTGPEIAARLRMTHGSVRVNLCKGMKLLRSRLEVAGHRER